MAKVRIKAAALASRAAKQTFALVETQESRNHEALEALFKRSRTKAVAPPMRRTPYGR